MERNQCSAHVHFRDRHGIVHDYLFTAPKQVIQTECLADVVNCVKQAEEASQRGYYVVGYVSYEAAPAFDKRLVVKARKKLPLAWFAIYERENIIKDFERTSSSHYQTGPWNSDTSKTEYDEAIQRIRNQIEDGVTYQTNYTIRLESDFHGDDFDFYQDLCKVQNASYSAYINLGSFRILSASPELFFECEDGLIITRPMKGTAARGKWYENDIAQRETLRTSIKDRAENVMIVDLLRNDLGRIAETDTVKVTNLCSVETYPTVHQMTSEVTARSRAGLADIFSALFPCGSITGAPKVSTMQIIESMEKSPREVYCGSIGLLLPQNHYIFNVAIRTVVIDMSAGKAVYGVGGGITWDSSANGEYQEILNKAAILHQDPVDFQIIETIRLDQGKYDLLSYHLDRMMKSAEYFGFEFEREQVIAQLDSIAVNHALNTFKVRILLDKSGGLETEISLIHEESDVTQRVALSVSPIHSNNPFLYHKTTHRDVYQLRYNPSFYDTLLWNERNEVTEFTTGNVVVKINNTLYTPPLESGLLPGTFRRSLLESQHIFEKPILKNELASAQEIWFINSVRGWVRVEL